MSDSQILTSSFPGEKLFSVKDIAKGGRHELIPLHEISVYRLIESGRLGHVAVGRRRLVSIENVQEFISKNTRSAHKELVAEPAGAAR